MLRLCRQVAGKDQCIEAAAIGRGIVAATLADPQKARRFVQGDGRGILGRDLEKGLSGPAQPCLIQEACHQLAPQAAAACVGRDGKGQKLGLARDGATEEEPRIAFDQKKRQRVGDEPGEIGGAPGGRRAETSGMQDGKRFGRHGRITGGGSAGGAASAVRR